MRDILFWVAVVELLGAAALPLTRAYFGNRRDAALLARPVGLVLVAYVGWALTRLLTGHFHRGTLLGAFLAVAAAGFYLNRRRKAGPAPAEAPGPFFGAEEKLAALIFWSTAGVFLLVRAAVPEIVGTEKFMDLAFLNSLTRHDQMPPLDPWMAGLTINYYYWGYLLAAVPAKLAGVNPSVAYNLALPTFAGLSACPAACLGFRLSGGRLWAGLGAAAATVFAGNVTGAFDALRNPLTAGFDYFPASRVIGNDPLTHEYTTISEFPFFTFFHADLHPHLLAFPFFIAAFALAHRFIERGKHLAPGEAWTIRRVAAPASSALLLALMAGTSAAASKWTLPAVGILLIVAGAFRTTRGRRLPELDEGLLGAVTGAGVLALALALFRDYELSYQLQDRGLGRTTMTSGLFEFLGVWGLMLAVCYIALRPQRPEDSRARERLILAVAAALSGSLLVALLVRPATPVLVVIGPLALLGGRLGWTALKTKEGDGRDFFTAFLLLFGLAMIAGCEFIYFRDSYGDRLQRMNTIFKFYNQAWPLLAIAAAVLAEEAWRREGRSRRLVRVALAGAAIVALLYPVECFVSRMRQRPGPFSLDARSALQRRNPDDLAAITWLEQNAPPGSIVMEAAGNPYSEFARIASHTGIPAVLGWANHEGLWRGNDREIGLREQAIRYFYTQPDTPVSAQILQRYRVTFVVVGGLERSAYPNAAAVAGAPYLDPAFEGGTTVYRVAQ